MNILNIYRPFETIHLNAPKGVNDYTERYIANAIDPILAEQGIKRNWDKKTWEAIHDEMSKRIPVDSLPDRCKWRDFRLLYEERWNCFSRKIIYLFIFSRYFYKM